MKRTPHHPAYYILRETDQWRRISFERTAKRLGMHMAQLDRLIHKQRGLTAKNALALSKVLGGRPELWMMRQARYDLAQLGHG